MFLERQLIRSLLMLALFSCAELQEGFQSPSTSEDIPPTKHPSPIAKENDDIEIKTVSTDSIEHSQIEPKFIPRPDKPLTLDARTNSEVSEEIRIDSSDESKTKVDRKSQNIYDLPKRAPPAEEVLKARLKLGLVDNIPDTGSVITELNESLPPEEETDSNAAEAEFEEVPAEQLEINGKEDAAALNLANEQLPVEKTTEDLLLEKVPKDSIVESKTIEETKPEVLEPTNTENSAESISDLSQVGEDETTTSRNRLTPEALLQRIVASTENYSHQTSALPPYFNLSNGGTGTRYDEHWQGSSSTSAYRPQSFRRRRDEAKQSSVIIEALVESGPTKDVGKIGSGASTSSQAEVGEDVSVDGEIESDAHPDITATPTLKVPLSDIQSGIDDVDSDGQMPKTVFESSNVDQAKKESFLKKSSESVPENDVDSAKSFDKNIIESELVTNIPVPTTPSSGARELQVTAPSLMEDSVLPGETHPSLETEDTAFKLIDSASTTSESLILDGLQSHPSEIEEVPPAIQISEVKESEGDPSSSITIEYVTKSSPAIDSTNVKIHQPEPSLDQTETNPTMPNEMVDAIPAIKNEETNEKNDTIIDATSDPPTTTTVATPIINVTTSKPTEEKEEPKNITQDDIETYSQFAERVAMEKKIDDSNSGAGSSPSSGNTDSSKPVKTAIAKTQLNKNYASWECGAKLLDANKEAVNALYVLSSEGDEYFLSNCKHDIWFIIELCESLRPLRIVIGNEELYSNLPKDIVVYGSQRFPTREWSELGKFTAKEERKLQPFYTDTKNVFRYLKVEILSHYGTEFFCPLSQLKVYGVSEFEVIDSLVDGDEASDDLPEVPIEQREMPTDLKKEDHKRQSALPTVLRSMLYNVWGVLNREAEQSLSSNKNIPSTDDGCLCLNPHFKVDARKCSLAPTINWHIGCYGGEYHYMLSLPIVRQTVQDRNFCKRLVDHLCRETVDKEMKESDFPNAENHKNPNVENHKESDFPNADQVDLDFADQVDLDYACSKRACGNNYVCVMLCSHHLLALCHITHYSTNKNVSITPCTPEGTIGHDNASQTVTSNEKKFKFEGIEVGKSVEKDRSENGKKIETGETDTNIGQNVDVKESSGEKTSQSKKDTAAVNAADNKSKKEDKDTEKGKGKNGETGKKDNGSPLPTVEQNTPLSSKETNGGPKESVVVRLTNKVKALEHNLSISSQYLEELSQRYKRQMEDLQRQISAKVIALNSSDSPSQSTSEHKQEQQAEQLKTLQRIEKLQEQIHQLTEAVAVVASEQQGLATKVVEQHLFLMLVEVVLLIFTFSWCMKRHQQRQLHQSPPQITPSTHSLTYTPPPYLDGSPPQEESMLPLQWHQTESRRQSSSGPAEKKLRRISPQNLSRSGSHENLFGDFQSTSANLKSKKKKRSLPNGALSRSNSSSGSSAPHQSLHRGSLPSHLPSSQSLSSRYTCDSGAKNGLDLQKRENNKAEQLSKSSAGVLFTGEHRHINPSSHHLNVNNFNNQNVRLMRISECSETSTHSLLNGIVDIPDTLDDANRVAECNIAETQEDSAAKHHRRGGSDSCISYNGENMKRKGKKGRKNSNSGRLSYGSMGHSFNGVESKDLLRHQKTLKNLQESS